MNFNEQSVNKRSKSDDGFSNGENIVSRDGELEVLTWLRDLEIGNSHED